MAAADIDSDLELKKRARRRLVGAVVLALLAAIVLPMVMDREPKPLNNEIQVRIPSRDSPFDGRIRTSAAPVTPATPKVPAAEQGSKQALSETAPEVAAWPAESNPVEHTPQSKLPPAVAQSDAAKPAVVDRHAEKAAPKVAEKPVEKVVKSEPMSKDNKLDESRARAILSGKAQTNSAAASRSGQFIVQLGVYGDPENARRVQARVKSEGYNSFAEQVHTASGARTRVRAGPFTSRILAEQARAKLKRYGLDGVVAPQS